MRLKVHNAISLPFVFRLDFLRGGVVVFALSVSESDESPLSEASPPRFTVESDASPLSESDASPFALPSLFALPSPFALPSVSSRVVPSLSESRSDSLLASSLTRGRFQARRSFLRGSDHESGCGSGSERGSGIGSESGNGSSDSSSESMSGKWVYSPNKSGSASRSESGNVSSDSSSASRSESGNVSK